MMRKCLINSCIIASIVVQLRKCLTGSSYLITEQMNNNYVFFMLGEKNPYENWHSHTLLLHCIFYAYDSTI